MVVVMWWWCGGGYGGGYGGVWCDLSDYRALVVLLGDDTRVSLQVIN